MVIADVGRRGSESGTRDVPYILFFQTPGIQKQRNTNKSSMNITKQYEYRKPQEESGKRLMNS